jgi:hypothetical protein
MTRNLRRCPTSPSAYYSQTNVFPGFSQNMCNNMGAGYMASDWQNWAADWTTFTLPQMEQSPLYNAVNFDFGMWDNRNVTVSVTRVPYLICPSESNAVSPASSPGYWGTNSYVANIGGPADFPASFTGAIVPYSSDANGNNWAYASANCGTHGFQSFTDGTSNTALFSEKLIGVLLNAPITPGSPNAIRAAFPFNSWVSSPGGRSGPVVAAKSSVPMPID